MPSAFDLKQQEKHRARSGAPPAALQHPKKRERGHSDPRGPAAAGKRPRMAAAPGHSGGDKQPCAAPRAIPSVPLAPKPPSKKVAPLPLVSEAVDLAAWFALAHERAFPKLTLLERAGIADGASFSCITDAVAGTKAALEACGVSLSDDGQPGQGPMVLCVSPNTDRAVDLVKQLHGIKNTHVAKLFARHMKLEEQAAFLKANSIGAAVGTPNRLLNLAEGGHLPLSRLRFVILDVVPDVKTFSLVTMPGVSLDFFKLWETALKRPGLDVMLLCE